MAVLDSLPGIEVTVCVDGEPLKEYEKTEGQMMLNESEGVGKKFEVAKYQCSATVKKFVESAVGQFFTIKCSVKNPYRYAGACTHVVFSSSVGGKTLSWAPGFNKEIYEKNDFSLTRVIKGNFYKEEGQELLQKLQFTETHSTECDNSIKAVTRLDGIGCFVGEIEVRVFRAMSLSEASLVSRAPLVSKAEIPENLLKGKAKSHSTFCGPLADIADRFGQGEVTKQGKCLKMKFYDDGIEYPVAIFHFHYSSNGDLEALGVVESRPEPESPLGCGHDSEPLPMPISEPRAPEKLFRDRMKELEAEAEATLSNNNFCGRPTFNPLANTFTPPSVKQEAQDAEPGRNSTPIAPLVPAGSSNVTSPINSTSWNLQDLDPTQTRQLFGQFLQYLETQGGGQPSQVPPSLPVGTTTAALPSLLTSTSSSDIVTTATPKPPVKREKEGNGSGSRKRRRKARGKVTIDLTEDDSDDDVVIDLDSD
ncbi:hypothetical protein BCON_0040g00600 [Botryotinia convoluta]|uniref:DUF7918 domain-containing protein n=1 Tax=Botryotinia convoluta TaxID=54673 RepID=A0A4Z1ITI1_9HELO|nr:hypothetical protein BCON_0040g00600 [Botryotinia convoluta]